MLVRKRFDENVEYAGSRFRPQGQRTLSGNRTDKQGRRMKIYFHLNIGGFSNCYIIENELTKEAIIIDPGKITDDIIKRIEDESYKLAGVFITHNHGSHVHGLKTLRKIYKPAVYAADWEVAGNDTHVITGDGKIRIAGLTVRYMEIGRAHV